MYNTQMYIYVYVYIYICMDVYIEACKNTPLIPLFRCFHTCSLQVTAITSKSHVQMVDIVSTRMLGQYGFLSEVFSYMHILMHALSLSMYLRVSG
jgi:hypothetical protein